MWPHWQQLLALHILSMPVHGLALMLHRASVLCLVNVFPGQCNPEQQPFATCHVGCNACHVFKSWCSCQSSSAISAGVPLELPCMPCRCVERGAKQHTKFVSEPVVCCWTHILEASAIPNFDVCFCRGGGTGCHSLHCVCVL